MKIYHGRMTKLHQMMSEKENSATNHGYENLPGKNDQITPGTSSEERFTIEQPTFEATFQKFQQMTTFDTASMDTGPKTKPTIHHKGTTQKYHDTKQTMHHDERCKEHKTDTMPFTSVPNHLRDPLPDSGQERTGTTFSTADVMPCVSCVKPPKPGPKSCSIGTHTISSDGASIDHSLELKTASFHKMGIHREQATVQTSMDTQPKIQMETFEDHPTIEQDIAHEIPYGGSDFVQVTGSHNKPRLFQSKQKAGQKEKRGDFRRQMSICQDLHIHLHFHTQSDDGENYEQADIMGDDSDCTDDETMTQPGKTQHRAVPTKERNSVHIHIHDDNMHICDQKQQTPKEMYEKVDITEDTEDTGKNYSPLDDGNEDTTATTDTPPSSPESAPKIPPRKPIHKSDCAQPIKTSCNKSYEKPNDWIYDDAKSSKTAKHFSAVPEGNARKGIRSWIQPYNPYDLPDEKVLDIFSSDPSLKDQVMMLYGNPWFYLYPDVANARQYISKRSEDGCFALVAENIENNPFQPFTILVVKGKGYINVPVLRACSADSSRSSKLMIFDKAYETVVEVLDYLCCNRNEQLGFMLKQPNDSSMHQTNASS